MYRVSDWKQGKSNYLMVKDDSTHAQHYMLQRYRSDIPEPVAGPPFNEYFENDSHGRVLLCNNIVIGAAAMQFGDRHLQRGPSNSDHEDFDYVFAYQCDTLPSEILAWFDKMRHGYWPPQEIFDCVRHFPCFLVPDGYYASLKKHLEWRITPNLIERKLMFCLTMVQRKCLVVLKMIKKQELVKYIQHEGCKFTTFHCKTALFFTLERTPSDAWTKPRLLECIVRTL